MFFLFLFLIQGALNLVVHKTVQFVCVSALKGRRISNGEAEEVDLKVRFP